MIGSIQDARSLQEAHRGRWSAAVRWAIAEELWSTGEFHADALRRLDMPEDVRRGVVGSQIAAAVVKGVMVKGEERASTASSRNAAKSRVYRITPKGRELFAGLFEAGPVVGVSDADESASGSSRRSPAAPSNPSEQLFEAPADHQRLGHFGQEAA